MMRIGTHRTHCCSTHGCKYSYTVEECPVENGTITQEYSCEYCSTVEEAQKALKKAKKSLKKSKKMAAKTKSFRLQHENAVRVVTDSLRDEETGTLTGEVDAVLLAFTTISWIPLIPEANKNIEDELLIFLRENENSVTTADLADKVVNFFENHGWESSNL